MRLSIVLLLCIGAAALLALAWWCILDGARLEPANGATGQRVELPGAGTSSDLPMAVTQPNDASAEAFVATDDGDSPDSRELVKEARKAGSDSAPLRRWEEMQLMFPQNPFSTEWWRWRLGFVRELAEDGLKASAGQGAGVEKARLEYARALDRIAIACLLDRQGRYSLCESVESLDGTEGGTFVLHEYGHHYTFLANEFPEWAGVERLQASFDERDGVFADSSHRLDVVVKDARMRFAEALMAVGG